MVRGGHTYQRCERTQELQLPPRVEELLAGEGPAVAAEPAAEVAAEGAGAGAGARVWVVVSAPGAARGPGAAAALAPGRGP